MKVDPEILLERLLGMAGELLEISEQGQSVSSDRGCSVLFGVVRDCAYEILFRAEREKERHQAVGLGHHVKEEVVK